MLDDFSQDSLARIQEIDLIFISSKIFLNFGAKLLQFGAEKTGKDAPVSSLLSLLIVFLVDGRLRGLGTYSSCQAGGEGWETGRCQPVITGID